MTPDFEKQLIGTLNIFVKQLGLIQTDIRLLRQHEEQKAKVAQDALAPPVRGSGAATISE